VCHQECALYGELVLWLRDQAAELLAGSEGNVEAETGRLDDLIRQWFFEPQDVLHGCAPRDLIWAEQMEQPNPIHPERIAEFFEDDCAVCQFEHEDLKRALEAGEDPGFHWHCDDGGFPLIARYDPEGYDARWAEEDAKFVEWKGQQEGIAAAHDPDGQTAPAFPRQLDPEEFLEVMEAPWLDPALRQAARTLAEHCDVPVPDQDSRVCYRRLTLDEAVSVLTGLGHQGTNIQALLAQIVAWPYENVALDWLSEPEQNVAMMCAALDQDISPNDEEGQTRFRHHRDFVLALAQVMPPGARLWLQGWLEATVLRTPAFDLPF
jgi:hypothetical protein